MFPNVRLLLAATFASILAVIFGFGMLAAVRVNQAASVRPPPTSATHFVADDSGTAIMAFAAVEPERFDRRFPATLPPSTRAATDLAGRAPNRPEGIDSSPAASATTFDQSDTTVRETAAIAAADAPAALASAQPRDASTATAAATSSRSANALDAGIPPDQPALPAAQPAQEPTAQSGGVVATANQTPVAPEPQPVPSAAAAPPSPPNSAAADASGKAEPASAATSIAVVAPSDDRSSPPDLAKSARKVQENPEHEADTRTRRAQGAARTHRKHKSATQAGNQYASYLHPDFVTAPQWQQWQGQKQPARSLRATVVARKPKDSDSASSGAWPNQ